MAKDIPKLKVQAFLKHPDVDTWKAEYKKLRDIVLACGLEEDFKWKHPCYTFDGENVVLIHGFKDYCALLFIKGALMKDPKKILIQQTKNVQERRQIRFTSLAEIKKMESTITTYIKEAIRLEKSGAKLEYKKTEEYDVPDELIVKFQEMPRFKEAFETLTPGRQRGYLLYFSGAKQSQTRTDRIEKYVDAILDGIGLNDDYRSTKKK
jgi:uncharacterized protein YdeI (YjbR/CyaY-like superfamily)